MAIFIDWMYPDNQNRKNRLNELASDCGNYLSSASVDYDSIKKQLEKTNVIIKEAFEKIGKEPPKLKTVEVFPDIAVTISELVAGIIAIPIADCAFKWACKTYLLKTGVITAEQLAEQGAAQLIKINFSKWLRVGGEIGAAIIVTVIFESITDAIDGAVQRRDLRNGIHTLISSRANMKRIAMINNEVLTACTSVAAAYQVMEEVGSYTEEELNKVARRLSEMAIEKMEQITKEDVLASLSEFDTKRGSWTKEDDSGSIVWDEVNSNNSSANGQFGMKQLKSVNQPYMEKDIVTEANNRTIAVLKECLNLDVANRLIGDEVRIK